MSHNKKLFPLFILLVGLTGCAGFNGVRAPLYDGAPVEPDEAAIDVYQESGEVVGDEKDYYFRYPFSEEVTAPSLGYPDEAPVLLEAGEYTIGEDLPAGRASLLGNESVFTGENYDVQVGNFVIRDASGAVYFENLFHSAYGQLSAQVDLISGHTIEIIGETPEITVFYEAAFPDDPYLLMEPPELLVNQEELAVTQPLVSNEGQDFVQLTAGIYEVGEHLEAGTYRISAVSAPHNTELFLFHEGEEARVFELIVNQNPVDIEEEAEEIGAMDEELPEIQLETGDKIYPNLVSRLELQKVSDD
jgi:hypothetical protein